MFLDIIFQQFLLLTLLAILVERALALFFEHKVVSAILNGKNLKEFIAFGVCFAICKIWSIDVISGITHGGSTHIIGMFITAAAIAGGSKASIKLFRDVLDAKSGKV